LRSNAADWVASVTSVNWADIEKAFEERFTQTDLRRWQHTGAVWSRKQNTGESVDDFVTQIKKLAKIAKIGTDDSGKNMLFGAVVQGLRPTVRAHVLQSGVDNLDNLLKAARVAEVSEVPANVSEPVLNTLLQEVKESRSIAEQNQAELCRMSRRVEGLTVAQVSDSQTWPAKTTATVVRTRHALKRGPGGSRTHADITSWKPSSALPTELQAPHGTQP
jgi:hypothetical protein